MRLFLRIIYVLLVLVPLSSATHAVHAVGTLEISGWIPYWKAEEGIASARSNLSALTEVNPFVYQVKTDGSLTQASPLSGPNWTALRTEARAAGVRFIPTIMWSDRDAIHDVLSNPTKRVAHIQGIAREVYAYGFDGIDIDYEGKYAKTKPYFSQFLQELYEAIGYDKWVTCTIEARTPLEDRYSSPEAIPADIEYANDFTLIGRACDRVRIMAYDQERIDLTLNDANPDPYVAVADNAWVEKVIRLAAAEIPKQKLVLGIPTYGYEYDMFPAVDGSGDMAYARLWSFNPRYATDIAAQLGISPVRKPWGELTLTFPAGNSPEPVKPLPTATRVLVWSDAEAIRQKVALAESLGLRGVAVFKIDGGQDGAMWNALVPSRVAVSSAQKTPDLAFGLAQTSVVTNTPSGVGMEAGASLTPPSRNLAPGVTHEDVRTLQKILNTRGFTLAAAGPGSPGNETAFFGNATYQALVKFQKTKNITPPVGHYGPKTRAALSAP